MRIVIDCFKLVKGSGKSIGIYNVTKHIVKNMAISNSAHDEIVVLGNKYNHDDFDIKGIRFVEVPYNPFNKIVCLVWELLLVSSALRKLKPDSVLFPRGFAPLWCAYPTTVVIHDMIPFYYDRNFKGVLNKYENFYIMWRLKASARVAENVITVSDYSKHGIAEIAKISEAKIHTIYNGITVDDGEKSSSINDLPAEYISAITSKLPHKNAEGVVKAYEQMYELRSGDVPDLVIIGIDNVDRFEIASKIKDKIKCIKFLEKDEDMYCVIGRSRVFLFLSLQEGFGFPPLEAMALGVPVVTSGESSLAEVVGNSAIVVNPCNAKEAAKAVLSMLDEEVGNRYIKLGNENVKKYSWPEAAAKYREVLVDERLKRR